MDDKDKPVDAPPDKTPVDPDVDKGPPVSPSGDINNPGKSDPPPPPTDLPEGGD